MMLKIYFDDSFKYFKKPDGRGCLKRLERALAAGEIAGLLTMQKIE